MDGIRLRCEIRNGCSSNLEINTTPEQTASMYSEKPEQKSYHTHLKTMDMTGA